MPEMERGHRKYQDGQVLTPCNEKVSLCESWEMLNLFRNIFHTNFLILLRASLCKILISSFAHKMDFANIFSVDFF